MTSEASGHEASRVVAAFLRAIEYKDVEAAVALVTDDVEYDNVPIGKVFGTDGIRYTLTAGMVAASDAIEWVVLRQVASGNRVMNERLDRFHVGDRWIEVAVAGVFELRDDRISLWRDYFDLQSFRDQMAR